MLILPDIKARAILVDPPVAFATRSRKGEGAFSGVGFAWVKQNRSGVGWFMGCGYGTRHNVEICWLGRRGSPKRQSAGVRELIIAPVREHSRKPDEVYARVEALGAGPYVELFARQQWPGWVCVGDEVGKFQREAAHDRSQ
jgi:N6-adenosine-specific RNA methylase IME4